MDHLTQVLSGSSTRTQKGQAGVCFGFPALMARLSLAEVGLLLLLLLALVSIHPEAAHNFHLDTQSHAAGHEGTCCYRIGIHSSSGLDCI